MLKAFLASLPDKRARQAWAVSCGTTLGHLLNCIYSVKTPKLLKPRVCVLIERHSNNQVRRWHLRPDWREIWPELAGHPDAPIAGSGHQTVHDDDHVADGAPPAALPPATGLHVIPSIADAAAATEACHAA